MSSWDCYSFRCIEMITDNCAEVAYWVTFSSAQAHFCIILVLNLQFVHNGKLKVFTGGITTYQLMKCTSSMSLWHFCLWFGIPAPFNTSGPPCVHSLWIPVHYKVSACCWDFCNDAFEEGIAMAMMLKYQDLGFTEAYFFSENRVPCSQGVCMFVSSGSYL